MRRHRNHYTGRSKHAIMEHEAALKNLLDRIRLVRLAGFLHDSLMYVGIKRLALADLNRRYAMAFQNLEKLLDDHAHSLSQRAAVVALLGRLQCSFEVVENAEKVAGNPFGAITPFLLAFALVPLLVVFEVGLR